MASLQKNIFEHISLMALEQVEMEFQREIVTLQSMQQNPQAMQDPMMQQQVMDLTMKIESRKAVLIAEMMEEYSREEKKILGDFANDPLAKLKSRELDLKARADQEKNENAEARLDLDMMRALMNQQNQDAKLQQNEELAGLRAGVSLAKQQMADASKIHDFGRNFPKKKV